MAMSAAQLLDELMGRDRNLAPSDHREEKRWDDADVCKYALVEFCPHELFTNTRADLGACHKVHDVEMARDYRKSSRFQKIGYEEQFAAYCNILLSDVNKRIERGHVRLQLNKQTAEENLAAIGNDAKQARENQLSDLNTQIAELDEKTEQLGNQGNVDEAQAMMLKCDGLKKEKSIIESRNSSNAMPSNDSRMVPGSTKEMEVCTVCGALLIVNDAQQRVDEHMQGKQHVGYTMIRAYVNAHDERMSKEGKRTSKDIFVQRDVERSTESNERYRPPHRTSDTRHTNGSSREIEKRKEHTTDKDRSRRSEGHRSSRSHRHRSRSRDRSRRHDRHSKDDRRSRRSRSR